MKFETFKKIQGQLGIALLAATIVGEIVCRIASLAGYLTDENRFQSEIFINAPKYLHLLKPMAKTNFSLRRSGLHVPVAINAYGFRDPTMRREKSPGSFRVACMGDSVTFGWEVTEAETYPRQLERRLREVFPQRPIEVLNFGVPGHNSTSGKNLFPDVVADFAPDLLIVGYGFNDWKMRPKGKEAISDLAGRAPEKNNQPFAVKLRAFLRQSYLFSQFDTALFKNLSRKAMPDDPEVYVHATSPAAYAENIRSIVAGARQKKIPVILLNTNFLNDFTRAPLGEIARREKIPFIDLRTIFAGDGDRLEPDLETWLTEKPAGLTKGNSEKAEILFRVFVPSRRRREVEKNGMYVFGNIAELGNFRIGSLALNDRGEAGDEKPGDGVYSRELQIETSEIVSPTIEYGFLQFPSSMRRLKGEPMPSVVNFLYFESLPRLSVKKGYVFVTPLHILGRAPYSELLLAGTDFVHPNGRGDATIAEALSVRVLPYLRASHGRKTLPSINSVARGE